MSTLSSEEARRLERSFYDAMTKRDEAALNRLVHEGISYIHSGSRIENKEQVLNTVLKERVYTSVDSAEVLTKTMDGVAVVVSKITLNAEGRPPNNLQQSQVWSEFPDGWKLVHRSSTKG